MDSALDAESNGVQSRNPWLPAGERSAKCLLDKAHILPNTNCYKWRLIGRINTSNTCMRFIEDCLFLVVSLSEGYRHIYHRLRTVFLFYRDLLAYNADEPLHKFHSEFEYYHEMF